MIVLNFPKSGSEKYLGFSTLLRSLDESIMARIVEISGGINVCGIPFKTRFKTVFSLLNCLEKFIKNFRYSMKKNAGASRPFRFNLE